MPVDRLSVVFDVVSDQVDFPDLESKILSFWKDREIFRKSLDQRVSSKQGSFVFYEGPPTANGLPHPGHVLTRVMKDLFPRYKTMRGFHVERKGGWDTHGLPVEIEVEKEIGISGKEEIERFGVEPFIRRCRQSVWRYQEEWRRMTERIGFWIDMDDPYITYEREYIESVWWALAAIWKKGLLVRGHKVLPYCPRCGTPLSSHEVGLGYREVDDPSAYVLFRLAESARLGLPDDTHLVAWTTTPWTLPSNIALAVHPRVEYALVGSRGRHFVLARERVEKVFSGEEVERLRTFSGGDLVGWRYEPLYTFVPVDQGRSKSAYRVVAGEFVSLEEGTGIVHIAPGFGEDDHRVGRQNDLPVLLPVDDRGCFTSEVPPWAGRFVKEADPEILRELKGRGMLLKKETHRHNYPFCWRCDSPLIYYARASWFIRTTQVKDRMLSNNRKIRWVPEHIRDGRFGEFLRNNVDWAISRERYWGTPLPLWICEGCGKEQAIASLGELRERNPETPEDLDLHRPYIDAVTFPCSGSGGCGRTMRRVPEVIDCWFDSGAMPFAQWGWPARGKERFERAFPADFICEAIDQTRGWFYSLLAIATLLEDELPKSEKGGGFPYRSCLVLGHVQDKQGFKMSKSKKNYLDPWRILNGQGADALRWYFYSSNHPWVSVRFFEEGVLDAQRETLLKLWNVYSFFVIYANIDRFDPAEGLPALSHLDHRGFARNPSFVPIEKRTELDQWIWRKLNLLKGEVAERLEAYDVYNAASEIRDFVEGLSNWYLRRSRDRFWRAGRDVEKMAAHWTLYEALVGLSRVMAPFTPFLSEELYRHLVVRRWGEGVPESVHLTDFPENLLGGLPADLARRIERVSVGMDLAREVVAVGHAARRQAGIKVRQPIRGMRVLLNRETGATLVPFGDKGDLLMPFWPLIADELNVKEPLQLGPDPDQQYVTVKMKPDFKLLGPKYGSRVKDIQKALQEGRCHYEGNDGAVSVDLLGERLVLEPGEVERTFQAKPGFAAWGGPCGVVVLQTDLDEELLSEGLAREAVHRIQQLRKQRRLPYEAHIRLWLAGSDRLVAASRRFQDYLEKETLADRILFEERPEMERFELEGEELRVALEVV
jgi:isoleucyl-tRNA synthetase